VEEGTPLIVMEAMKMENELKADRPGTVKDVRVEEGQTVKQSDLLVRIE
jgi:biotin carboxyl carrier protein